MAFQAEQRLIGRHSDAIVGYDEGFSTAHDNLHVDLRCPRIDGILDQLLEHGGRALDHLPRCDLVCNVVGEDLDGRGIFHDPVLAG